MQHEQITKIINNLYPADQIHTVDLTIGINAQIDYLKIIFFPNITPDLTKIGNLINDLDNLTLDDQYGDMTELDFKYSTYEEIENEELTVSFTFTINIDS